MDFRPVLYINGIFLCVLSVFMVIPTLCDLATDNLDWVAFAIGMALTGFSGVLLILANKQDKIEITGRQTFALTGLSWILLSVFSAIPFLIAFPDLGFADAVFETVSGLTTTGSTVMSGLDTMPYGILIWRALLQWLGGIGIIVMAISVLPFLRVGGMQLFRLESSEKEKPLPKVTDMAKALCIAYFVLSFACYLAYYFCGMTHFEAVIHSMTTVSTGGYSTTDASFGNFSNATKLFSIVFMILAAFPFIIFVKMYLRSPFVMFEDEQTMGFLKLQALFIFIIITFLFFWFPGFNWDTVVDGAFNIVSVSTGTGYASSDYNQWAPFALGFILFASCIGGCAGSASCGIKIFRFQILYAVAKTQIMQLIYPNGVFTVSYNKQPLSIQVAASVMAFFFIFVTALVIVTLALLLCGLDILTALSGAITTLSNVGPGLGDIIGPAGNFSSLPDSAKWIMILSMLLGRLEFFTLLVFFVPRFWRN